MLEPWERILTLGLDRAESRGFIALIFLLFRDSFEGNTAIFLAVGGAAGLPGTNALVSISHPGPTLCT